VIRDREGAFGRGIVAYLSRVLSDYTVREIGDHYPKHMTNDAYSPGGAFTYNTCLVQVQKA